MFYDLDLIEKVDQPEQIRVGVRFAKNPQTGVLKIKELPTSLLKTKQENGVLKI